MVLLSLRMLARGKEKRKLHYFLYLEMKREGEIDFISFHVNSLLKLKIRKMKI